MAQFSDRMVPEVVQVFWAAMARGEFVTAAAAEAGTYREKGTRWLRVEGGIRPRRGRDLKGRGLTFYDREEIAVARAGGESMRSIARRLGRRRRRSAESSGVTPVGPARRWPSAPRRSARDAARPDPLGLPTGCFIATGVVPRLSAAAGETRDLGVGIVGAQAERRAVSALSDDLASGAWRERNRGLLTFEEAELGARLRTT